MHAGRLLVSLIICRLIYIYIAGFCIWSLQVLTHFYSDVVNPSSECRDKHKQFICSFIIPAIYRTDTESFARPWRPMGSLTPSGDDSCRGFGVLDMVFETVRLSMVNQYTRKTDIVQIVIRSSLRLRLCWNWMAPWRFYFDNWWTFSGFSYCSLYLP